MTDYLGAKILEIDIESTPLIGYAWKTYDTNLIEVIEDWKLLCVAAKWLHEKKITVYGTDEMTERKLTKTIWELFDEADIVVGHNGDRFDIKKLQAKMLEYKLHPPSPFKTVDTLKIARNHFGFTSNKLGELGKKLKLGNKQETGGFQLWKDCMNNCPKAWKKMREYNKHDVLLMEKLYIELRPWTPRHPNMAAYTPMEEACCGICGSEKLQMRGYYHTNAGVYQRFICRSCGAWGRGRKSSISSVKNIVCDRR